MINIRELCYVNTGEKEIDDNESFEFVGIKKINIFQ